MKSYYAYLASGEIVRSGTLQDEVYAELSVDGLTFAEGVAHPHTHYVDSGEPVMFPHQPSHCHKFNYKTKQWEPDLDAAWAKVRLQRNSLIQASDWTTLPDVPLTSEQKAQWAAYRQALRDVTKQADPLNIVWPSAPT